MRELRASQPSEAAAGLGTGLPKPSVRTARLARKSSAAREFLKRFRANGAARTRLNTRLPIAQEREARRAAISPARSFMEEGFSPERSKRQAVRPAAAPRSPPPGTPARGGKRSRSRRPSGERGPAKG